MGFTGHSPLCPLSWDRGIGQRRGGREFGARWGMLGRLWARGRDRWLRSGGKQVGWPHSGSWDPLTATSLIG